MISRTFSAGMLGSLAFHGAVLAATGAVLVQPVQYAVESGFGGIEVQLVAAPARPAAPAPQVEAPVSFSPQIAAEEAPLPHPAEQEKGGDGSSPVPGLDETTLSSAAGAVMEAQPDYLQNPAPAYPRAARTHGWEGLVVLRVRVDASGRPRSVTTEKSAGYPVLDESAVRTVRTWKFRPARAGSLPVESWVRVPVRFRLEGHSARLK